MESLAASIAGAQPPSPSPSSVRAAVDINSASVFELMTVRGLTQETAASITEYRGRRGPFHSVDQLTKVKGTIKFIIIKIVVGNLIMMS
jgi:competence protein ComEA